MRPSAGRASRSASLYSKALCRAVYCTIQCRAICCEESLSLGVMPCNMRHYQVTRSRNDTVFIPQVHEDFFSKPGPMQLYKDSVQKIIGRVNTIHGRMYRDDPTIMAWYS